ncbi:SAV_2336 N-terminal domain-related protein [Streptomyces sp. NPDC059176]|uniref:SAV_2336 N-terminal domain-related protein n=1 Tax=Streptomyces sp. NPDC059176 TaxID=3346758 RepID=UPI0036B03A17
MWQELRRVLGDGGTELAHEELLDAVWLAERLPPGAAAALAAAGSGAEGADGGRPPPYPPSSDRGPAGPVASAPAPHDTGGNGAPPRHGAGPGAAVHGAPAAGSAGSCAPSRPATPVRVPEARALASAELRLGRALRPLKHLRPDHRAGELDESATVTAIADTGVPDVVLRPARTRWLDLVLLVDDGVSMLLWQRLAAETRRLLERSGAFRDVRVYGLDTRGPDAPVLGRRPFSPEPRSLSLDAVADPGGRTMLLVVSDGVGRAWRDGRMHRVLERACGLGPVAVLHALPERLWEGSGIRAERWRVTAPRRGGANRTWQVADPVLPPDVAPYTGVPVPVLAPDPASVGAWAQLVGSAGASAVLPLLAPRTPPRRYAATRTNDGDGLLRFRDAASPEAYRLAAHLAAVAPLSVPAMRLVQDALGGTDTGHLAEVFLGGLMQGVDGGEQDLLPQHRGFDFAEDARRILLHTVPPAELVRNTMAVTARMAELADGTAHFPAWLPHPTGGDEVASGARPFGWLDDRLLRRLGMPVARAPAGTGEPLAAAATAPPASVEPQGATGVAGVAAASPHAAGPSDGTEPSDPAARPPADELCRASAPEVRPVRAAPPPLPLGRDDAGGVVSLDLNGPEHGGTGPHGLLHGGTDPERGALLSGLVQRLAETAGAAGLAVVCADHDGALRRSGLASLPQVLWCEAVGGRPELLRELAALLAGERRRRATTPPNAEPPRLLVVLGDLDRTAGNEEPFFTLVDEVTSLGRCAGVHVLVSQRVSRSPLVDLLAPSFTIDLEPPRARLLRNRGAPVAFDPLPVRTQPAREHDHDARYAHGVELLRDGRPELALRVLGEVVATRNQVLGAGHAATLTSRYALAAALLALARYAEALTEYRQVAQSRSRLLGTDHPDALDARQRTALALGLLGRHSEALTQYLDVLSKRERRQGTAHEDTLGCRHGVASTLSAMGRLVEASKVALETYRARSEVLGELHTDTLDTLHELARTTARMEDWAEAAALFEKVAAGRARTLGPGHPDTVTAARNAASARRRRPSERTPLPPGR